MKKRNAKIKTRNNFMPYGKHQKVPQGHLLFSSLFSTPWLPLIAVCSSFAQDQGQVDVNFESCWHFLMYHLVWPIEGCYQLRPQGFQPVHHNAYSNAASFSGSIFFVDGHVVPHCLQVQRSSLFPWWSFYWSKITQVTIYFRSRWQARIQEKTWSVY